MVGETMVLIFISFKKGMNRHSNPLQCSCLENPRDQGSLVGYHLWGRTEADTTE